MIMLKLNTRWQCCKKIFLRHHVLNMFQVENASNAVIWFDFENSRHSKFLCIVKYYVAYRFFIILFFIITLGDAILHAEGAKPQCPSVNLIRVNGKILNFLFTVKF